MVGIDEMMEKAMQQLEEVIKLEKELDEKFFNRNHSKEQTFLKSLRILEYCRNANFSLPQKITWGGHGTIEHCLYISFCLS